MTGPFFLIEFSNEQDIVCIFFAFSHDTKNRIEGYMILHDFVPFKGSFFSKPLDNQSDLNHFWPKILAKI